LVDFEVVAPAGEFESVVAHLFREWGEFFEGKVGPLAGEQGDGSWHTMEVLKGGLFEILRGQTAPRAGRESSRRVSSHGKKTNAPTPLNALHSFG
jgi:hypothetical protein